MPRGVSTRRGFLGPTGHRRPDGQLPPRGPLPVSLSPSPSDRGRPTQNPDYFFFPYKSATRKKKNWARAHFCEIASWKRSQDICGEGEARGEEKGMRKQRQGCVQPVWNALPRTVCRLARRLPRSAELVLVGRCARLPGWFACRFCPLPLGTAPPGVCPSWQAPGKALSCASAYDLAFSLSSHVRQTVHLAPSSRGRVKSPPTLRRWARFIAPGACSCRRPLGACRERPSVWCPRSRRSLRSRGH